MPLVDTTFPGAPGRQGDVVRVTLLPPSPLPTLLHPGWEHHRTGHALLQEMVVDVGQPRQRKWQAEDDDVIAERARVEDGRADADRVQLRHLRKVYATQPPKVRGSPLFSRFNLCHM